MTEFEQEVVLEFQPSPAAVEAAARAQWDYEVKHLTNNALPQWDTLDEPSRAMQRANIRLTLTVAYAAEAPRIAAAIQAAGPMYCNAVDALAALRGEP